MSNPPKSPEAAFADFPGQAAATLRFSLGAPKNFAISPDGHHVLYLRSAGPRDRSGYLHRWDVATAVDTVIADPFALLTGNDELLSVEERARRERMREGSAGITSFSTDRKYRRAVFALSGAVHVTDIAEGSTQIWPSTGSVIDPRLSPNGTWVAYATTGGDFRLCDSTSDRLLCTSDGPDISFGVAEFVAAEEMNRLRGFWWSPDSTSLLVTRVDETPVAVWHLSDPTQPDQKPRAIRYPSAGRKNAEVRLFHVDIASGLAREVIWDREEYEYLTDIHWSSHGPALVHVMSRNQQHAHILAINPTDLTTTVIAEEHDPAWIDLIPGTPQWSPSGGLITTIDSGNDESSTRHLAIDGFAVTPVGLNVASILDIDRHGITFHATTEPTEMHVWWLGWGGELTQLSSGPGVHTGRSAGHTLVLISRSLERYGARFLVRREGQEWEIPSLHEEPGFAPRVQLLHLGESNLRAALVMPLNWKEGDPPLPVLVDSYAGPHAQRVVASLNAYAECQWFAEQGFAVLVVDGRGTPSRGPSWERKVHLDLATPVLEDQIEALQALIDAEPERYDRQKVALRGWSFGGYLAALGVLRRPDVFAAGVAGAPVTDWSLYDTFYTERYLSPDTSNQAYTTSSLMHEEPSIKRPLLIIHGLADDNVVLGHALRLSDRLLRSGHPHELLPLSGITHMASDPEIAKNLLTLVVAFLKKSLDLDIA